MTLLKKQLEITNHQIELICSNTGLMEVLAAAAQQSQGRILKKTDGRKQRQVGFRFHLVISLSSLSLSLFRYSLCFLCVVCIFIHELVSLLSAGPGSETG